LVPECSRDLIVAGRGRKSSASFGTPAVVRFDLSNTVIWYKPTWPQAGPFRSAFSNCRARLAKLTSIG
jgi:hypothetical protein